MRVLLVEDDESLANGILTALRSESYTIDPVNDGRSALHAVSSEHFDLVILDLGLPKLDGLSVLRAMRDRSLRTPVLILTARDGIKDRIAGLDAGADDYLIKPFDTDELKARLRALLRRSAGRAAPIIEMRDVTLNPGNQQVTYQGQMISLSRNEYLLLHELLSQPDRVLTRDQLEQCLYGWADDVDSNTLEVHIHHLRKKLYPQLIRTLRGVGYMIESRP
ncbi:MAG: DNA-binding response regulator [Gammaproteobacteria bacterium]|nr:DNA-binding response regulator [Gammaproteobacteria bacterium]MBJ55257.1 DNA-binding response regulator [Gammaproteobacteria bacterium]HBN16291.1 DNA-binding response regulator [Pseudohongiella sp.]|tara:strand:- start:574 stop:1236 length:663 start_codon:yes stop_codon:yes gene_type:complete